MATVLEPGLHRFLPGNPNAKPKKTNLVAFDTEFDTDTGAFICGAYYGEVTNHHGKVVTISEYCATLEDFQATFERLEQSMGKRNRFTLIGYNSAVDIVYLGNLIDSSTRLDVGSKFLTARTKGGTRILDCSNHVIGTLESWITRLNMKEQYGIIKREGYLNTEEGKRSQCLDDARATYILSCWIRDLYANEFGITLPLTKFSAALKIYQKHYFKGAWCRYPREQWKNDYERESYYGGRVECFKRGDWHVHSYDVNGMYVSIMRDEKIPNPTIAKWVNDPIRARELFDAGEFMTMDVTVTAPVRRVGLLPYRDTVNKKLLFPSGTWRGKYNAIEIRTACEFGLTIDKIHSALWYPESEYYFHEYAVMTLEGRNRCKAEGDAATEQFYKYLGNGLYGKFAQRNAEGGQYVALDDYQGDLTGKTIIWRDETDGYVVIPKSEQVDALHTFPVVAATITAYARSMILRGLIANEETVVYCDTDSIKCVGEAAGIVVGDEPGMFGYEYEATETYHSPKCYGKKRKGVPKQGRQVMRLFDDNGTYIGDNQEGEDYIVPVWTKYRSSIVRHKPQNLVTESLKHLSLTDSKRVWTGNESMPVVISS